MARRSFKLVKDLETHFDSVTDSPATEESEVKWIECFICQENSKEKLVFPGGNNRRLDLKEKYSKILEDIRRFEGFEQFSLPLKGILQIENLEHKCTNKKAVYHKRCRTQYDDLHYQRAIKRVKKTGVPEDNRGSSTKTRSQFAARNFQKLCFLCDQSTKEALSEVRTFQLDERVRYSAKRLLDEKLLAKLCEGDLVATEACYHKNCLKRLYNRVRAIDAENSNEEKKETMLEGIAIAEIENYIRHCIEEANDTVPVFNLKELKDLYVKRMEFHGCGGMYEHSTRFNEKILALIPELTEHKRGRGVILTIHDGIGDALFKACDLQDDGMCLARAATIIRNEILCKSESRNRNIDVKKFNRKWENQAVSQPVLSFIDMVINGSDVVNDTNKKSDAALTIAQLLQFNTRKSRRKQRFNETPFPHYLGLMVHAKTRRKGLIEELSEHGLSVSYKRVMEVQTDITKQLCTLYNAQKSVCPPKLQKNAFTVAAIDNLDHNPTSSTAKTSFHGTGISIFQYSDNKNQMNEFEEIESCQDVEFCLPTYYTTVLPTMSARVNPPVPTIIFQRSPN